MPLQLIEFALALYADKRVAGPLLEWQERFGVDINVIIYAAWLGAEKSALASDQSIRMVDAAVAQWREQVVVPLRRARKWLKAHEDFDEQSRHIRRDVKRVELEAELASLRRLAIAPPPRAEGGDADDRILHNLRTALSHFGALDADLVAADGALRELVAAARAVVVANPPSSI